MVGYYCQVCFLCYYMVVVVSLLVWLFGLWYGYVCFCGFCCWVVGFGFEIDVLLFGLGLACLVLDVLVWFGFVLMIGW